MSDNGWIPWVIGGIAVVLAVAGLFAYTGKKEDERARQKAQELTQKLEQAGLRTPEDEDVFVRTFGDDGGAMCDDPGHGLRKAVLFDGLSNGAAHVGRRPVIADRSFVRAGVLILDTYCPDEVEEFRDVIADLKFDDTVEN
jgi:hypothetical protein